MIEDVMDTPMPDNSSKTAEFDYTTFLKKDNHHLSCPKCEIIPALFIEKESKNLFSISSGCENKHVVHNMSVRDFYKQSLTKNEINEKETITTCQEHNEQYDSFCKTCHKNICSQCFSKSHQNHNIMKFKDLQPSNDEIKNLKNSIKNEIKITSEFFTLEFNRWLDELRDKFEDVLDVISYKNKLYNQIISNYESGNLNYQIIHNIKIILKDQMSRNPISRELAKLLKIINASKKDEKQISFNSEKNNQFLHILDIENDFVDINSNNNSNNNNILKKSLTYNNPEQSFTDFINNSQIGKAPPAQPKQQLNMPNKNNYNLNQSVNNYNNNYSNVNPNPNKPINPFADTQLNRSYTSRQNYYNQNNSGNNYQNNNYNNKNSFYNTNKDEQKIEFQLKGKNLKQNIDLKEFIHSMSILKSHNSQKFAVGLENGIAKIFSFDEKSGEISSYCDVKEHEKSITTVVGLNNGNLLTCSQDKTLKIINIPQKSITTLFKNYSVLQVLQCKSDAFYVLAAIEMTDGTLIAGDWKNIIIWRPFKKEGSNEGFEYRELNQIVINDRTTALLQVDDGVFISAHYGISLLNFYDTRRQRTNSLRNIKCSDDSPNCLCIISTKKNGYEDDGDNSDKVVVVGGIQCIFFVSVKYQSLIYKLSLPDVSYLRTIVNTGYKFYSSSIICSGLFRQYCTDLVLFNVINQGGYNKFTILENFRLVVPDKGNINQILLLKKLNVNDSSGIVMVTGGNEKRLKVYV